MEYIGLAIIHQALRSDENFGKVLIVRKEEKVPSGATLTWGFPSSRLIPGKTLEESLVDSTKAKVNLDISIIKPIFAWLHPDHYASDNKGGQMYWANITYFAAEPEYQSYKIVPDGKKILEAKWVDPRDVVSHFTTKSAPEIGIYLGELKIKPREV